MSKKLIHLDEITYTAKDIETYLSHLAHWYQEDRKGTQDILLYMILLREGIQRYYAAREESGANKDSEREFSDREVVHMFRRLMRRYRKVGREGLVIRPKRIIAAMRALRTKKARAAEKRAT